MEASRWRAAQAVVILKFDITVKILNIRTPEKFAVLNLKFEQGGFTIEYCILLHPDGIAIRVDPD